MATFSDLNDEEILEYANQQKAAASKLKGLQTAKMKTATAAQDVQDAFDVLEAVTPDKVRQDLIDRQQRGD